jgi:hypothetical protein
MHFIDFFYHLMDKVVILAVLNLQKMKSKSLLLFMGALALTMTSCETENVSETNATARQASMTAAAAVAPIDNLTPCAHSELLAGQRYDAGDIKVY